MGFPSSVGIDSLHHRRVSSGTILQGAKAISPLTAAYIVIANMIGTGIFTSLGFQVGDLPVGFDIMAV